MVIQLTEKQEAALEWHLNKTLEEQISKDTEQRGHVSWAGNHPEEYKATLRKNIVEGDGAEDRVANIEKMHEVALKSQFGIGSRPGRSVAEG